MLAVSWWIERNNIGADIKTILAPAVSGDRAAIEERMYRKTLISFVNVETEGGFA